MEKISLDKDISVFGMEVKTFPEKIEEAFDLLVEQVPGGLNRSFYGICYLVDGSFKYFATAEEKEPGEALRLGYDTMVIPRGNYMAVTLLGWRDNIPEIKNTFCEMMKEVSVDSQSPSIEWYKNDDEMVCMIKATPTFATTSMNS